MKGWNPNKTGGDIHAPVENMASICQELFSIEWTGPKAQNSPNHSFPEALRRALLLQAAANFTCQLRLPTSIYYALSKVTSPVACQLFGCHLRGIWKASLRPAYRKNTLVAPWDQRSAQSTTSVFLTLRIVYDNQKKRTSLFN